MSDLRERIKSLLTLAEHPNTPRAEAESALAMAYKLMQKYGIVESDIAGARNVDDSAVVVRRFHVRGPYRVRRQNILWLIATYHSCVGYRSHDDNDECVVVLYGRDNDITAAHTLWGAADVLGMRLLPRGDRSFRTSWWYGFQRGISEALSAARKEFVDETPGAGLVLADRTRRAEHELRTMGPSLRGGHSYTDSSSGAYASGKAAGRGFVTGGRSFTSGVRGELG